MKLTEAIEKRAGEELKRLLETKHLYQSTSVTEDSIIEILPARRRRNAGGTGNLRAYSSREDIGFVVGELDVSETVELRSLLSGPWQIVAPRQRRFAVDTGLEKRAKIEITLISVKTRCGSCGEHLPMNLVAATDVASGIWDDAGLLTRDNFSVYALSFQCQGCRDGIEVFLVCRENNKMTLVGRSPMEQVDVPKFIPKAQRKYYSGAVIAFNSGQILAGLFLLRVLIEQFTREITKVEGKADAVLDQYMESLPTDFSGRFPSLRKIYGTLSDSIHLARESPETFENVIRDIEKHFEARTVFDKNPIVPTD